MTRRAISARLCSLGASSGVSVALRDITLAFFESLHGIGVTSACFVEVDVDAVRGSLSLRPVGGGSTNTLDARVVTVIQASRGGVAVPPSPSRAAVMAAAVFEGILGRRRPPAARAVVQSSEVEDEHTVRTLPGALDTAGLILGGGSGGFVKPTRPGLSAVGAFAVSTEFAPTSALLVHASGGGGGSADVDGFRVHVSTATSAVASMLGALMSSRRAPSADTTSGHTANASPMYQVVWQCVGAAPSSTNGRAATLQLLHRTSGMGVLVNNAGH
jgi:hypothetical protein